MKKITSLLLTTVLFASFLTKAQNVTITPSGITPAMSGTYPRLSYDAINALPSPQDGDMAYDLTFSCLRVYNSVNWVCTQSSSDVTPNIAAIITAGGTSSDQGDAVAVDASGNVFITGSFNGTVNFGGISKTSVGFSDIYVAKYNRSGVLQWVETANGPGYNSGAAIALDASGNVYITGGVEQNITFGATSKTSAGGFDIFVAKYNNSGVFQWVQTAGGAVRDFAKGIAIDPSGDVYITGEYSGTAYFNLTSRTSAGGSDIFIAKYNNSGAFQWVQSAGGTGIDVSEGIAIDAYGKLFIIGYYSGAVYFNANLKTSAGLTDIFVAKYDPSVNLWLWAESAGGSNYDSGKGISLDVSGNVFITGYFSVTANFNGTPKISEGSWDYFVAKYNTSTGALQWVQTGGGSDADRGNAIKVDASGDLFITGYFSKTATFGGTSKTSAGGADIFVTKYNNSGDFQWVTTAGGTNSDIGYGIAVDGNKNIYATGRFTGTAKFGVKSKTSAGDTDIFVARIQE